MAQQQLDELDEKILKLIIGNARIPFLEVARACDVSGAAIHQRIQKLTKIGVIKGSEYIVDNKKVGFETCAYMGLFLKSPGQFPAVTEALRNIPEVVECHYTTGQYDLFIKIYARDNQHLLNIIHNQLQPLGLARTESLISFKEAFKRQIPIEIHEELDKETTQPIYIEEESDITE
jgi:Lrp/AsnC family transcriptional regulator for asnA, asnC and gidA